MNIIQGKKIELLLLLTFDGAPVTGLDYEDITVRYRKYGDLSITNHTLLEDDVLELESGWYVISLPEVVASSVGSLWVQFDGAAIDNIIRDDLYVWPAPAQFLSSPDKCVVNGHISDLGGEAESGPIEITFGIQRAPQASGYSFITGKTKRTTPDYSGNFSVPLARGVKVLVQIPSAGIKHVVTIPDQETVNLIDLLPPIRQLT